MSNVQPGFQDIKKEITFTKGIIAILSVLLFFILPCVAIGNFTNGSAKPQPKNVASATSNISAKVAGASTSTNGSVISIPVLNVSINSQSGLFVIVGFIFLSVPIILIIYLIMDKEKRKHKKFKY